MKFSFLSLGRVLLLVLPCSLAIAASSVRVVDGDGLRIEDQRIRLWGIDAPELHQTCQSEGHETQCGKDARLLLGALIQGGDLVCETKNTDPYGRTVAQCFAGGVDLAGEMVRQGYALDWPRYSKGFYATQESEAREHGRGLWAGTFIVPWEWRHSDELHQKRPQ